MRKYIAINQPFQYKISFNSIIHFSLVGLCQAWNEFGKLHFEVTFDGEKSRMREGSEFFTDTRSLTQKPLNL